MNAVENADDMVLTGLNVALGLVSSADARGDELHSSLFSFCFLYTSDAADYLTLVYCGGGLCTVKKN